MKNLFNFNDLDIIPQSIPKQIIDGLREEITTFKQDGKTKAKAKLLIDNVLCAYNMLVENNINDALIPFMSISRPGGKTLIEIRHSYMSKYGYEFVDEKQIYFPFKNENLKCCDFKDIICNCISYKSKIKSSGEIYDPRLFFKKSHSNHVILNHKDNLSLITKNYFFSNITDNQLTMIELGEDKNIFNELYGEEYYGTIY